MIRIWRLSRVVVPILLIAGIVLVLWQPTADADRAEDRAAMAKRYAGILSYPGPLRNPVGFHWSASAAPDAAAVRAALPLLRSMRVGWMKLVVTGDNGVEAARVLAADGIEPIIRFYAVTPHPEFRADPAVVRKYVEAGANYFETGNEPNSIEEWKNRTIPPNAADLLAEQWIANAFLVRQGGGIPLFYAMMPGSGGIDLFRATFAVIQQRNQLASFDRAAIAVHNRPFNHPLDYPDDAINKRNPRYSEVRFDDSTFRSYEVYDDIVYEFLGRSLPQLATEAGYAIGSYEDSRYPPVDSDVHSRGNVEILNGFREGRWRDSLINQCFWLLGAYGNNGWPADVWQANPTNGNRDLPAIDALKALPAIERRFSADSLTLAAPAPYKFRQGDWEAVVTLSASQPTAGSSVGVNIQVLEKGRPVSGVPVSMTTRYDQFQGVDRFPDTDGDGRTVRAISIPIDERQGSWEITTDSVSGRRSVQIAISIAPAPTAAPATATAIPTVTVQPSATARMVPTSTPFPTATATRAAAVVTITPPVRVRPR